MMTADARLIDFVRRCRRRLLLAGFVRYASCAAAVLALLAAVAAFWQPPTTAALLTAAIAAIAIGAIAAWLRAPTMKATAHLVDQRHQLQNSLAAALQVREHPVAIGDLVVRHALDRISGLDAARAIPMGTAWPVAIAGVAIGLAAAALSVPHDTPSAPRPGGIRIATGAGNQSVSGSDPADVTERVTNADGGNRRDAANGQPARSDSTQPGRRSLDSSSAENATPAAQPGERSQSPASSTGRGDTGDLPGSGRSSAAPAGNTSASSSLSAPGDVGGSQRAAGTGRGASGVGITSSARAGGVGQAPLGPTGQAGITAVSGSSMTAGVPPQGQRPESALLNEEVPPHLRPYVRSYFQAIRP